MTDYASSRNAHPGLLAVMAAGLTVLSACSGSNPAAPSPGSATPSTRTVVEGNDSLSVGFARATFFSIDRGGTLEATVDYTSASSQIAVWLARGKCTFEQFDTEQCSFAALSMSGDKPRRVTATGVEKGDYTLITGNFGPIEERVSFRVVLTSAGTMFSDSQIAPASTTDGWYRARSASR
jgi:hypothetical protein